MENINNVKENTYILSLDAGKDSVKAIGINQNDNITCLTDAKKICFKTKTYDLKNGYIDIQGNSHKVIYNNQELIVGDQGTDRSFNTSKTEPLHQISAYAAITQFIESGENIINKIKLVLACPITVLKSDKAKNDYKALIKGDGVININVDDKEYNFIIEDVMLKAEGSGVLFLIPEFFRNKKVAVIDFGGLNMTVSIFNNGTCINPETDRFAEEFGQIQLVNHISRDLIHLNDGNIIDFDTAEEALNRGYLLDFGRKNVQSVKVIEESKNKFFNKAITKLNAHGINLKHFDNVVFVGGTTNHLINAISDLENSYTLDQSQWSTAEGLFKIALKKYKG